MPRTDVDRRHRITRRAPLLVLPLLAIPFLAWLAAPAGAQIAWEAPRLLGPESPVDVGVAWVRFGGSGGGRGIVGMWQPAGLPGPVSLRGGLARDGEEDPVGMVGMDVRVPVTRRIDGSRFDVSWSAGSGVVLGEFIRVSVPVDLAVGRSWASGSVWVAPYLTGGLVMDLDLGDEAPDQEFTLRPTAGAGLDFALDPDRRVVLRAGMAFGDHEAVAIGATVRMGGG